MQDNDLKEHLLEKGGDEDGAQGDYDMSKIFNN